MTLNLLKYIIITMKTFPCSKFSTFPEIVAAYKGKSFRWQNGPGTPVIIRGNKCYQFFLFEEFITVREW